MERFNVRIALHGASPAIYDMLGEAMSRMGGAGFAETHSGRMRRLRPGEYEFHATLDAHAMLRRLEPVVRAIWMDSGLRVTGERESCGSGSEPIPQPPTEEGKQRHATLR